jgi:tRNA threonylcarbamoyladenosine biosynthesis protein TsaE
MRNMKKLVATAKNTNETQKIAKTFLAHLSSEDFSIKKQASVVGLYGNLGAGKTTFTQYIAQLLNIKRKVNSPTFVIMKRYPIGKIQGKQKWKNLFHIDAYRLKNEKELSLLGFAEILSNRENLIFIEWPENVQKAMPKKHHKIDIAHTKEGHRKFSLKML